MQESIYEYVLKELQQAKGTWPKVADDTGVSLRTIEKIARKETANPGVISVERLARYFQDQGRAA